MSGLIMVFGEDYIDLITMNDGAVDLSSAKKAIPVIAVVMLLDSSLHYLNGLVRALGLQPSISIVSILCVWLVGVPSAYLLSEYGPGGIYGGYYMSTLVQIVIIPLFIFKKDW